MDRQAIIARLRENEPALRARGVMHAALFGSRARGDARPDSNTDIMVEIDPAIRLTLFERSPTQSMPSNPALAPHDIACHIDLTSSFVMA